MLHRCLFNQYKTIKGALRYAAPNWTGPVRFEFFRDETFYRPDVQPFKVVIRGE
jgi:hypothetical protein